MSLFKQILRNILHLLCKYFKFRTCLGIIEKIILLKRFESSQPQLFILGLPRSGTTIVYQYIVHRLKVAYFTNGVGRYSLSPCLVTFFQNRIYGKYKSDFKSNYGKVAGPIAPREAGGFWGRFFGIEGYVRYRDVNTNHINKLQNTIACIQHIFADKPFVNKNVKHMLRIDALGKIFPNSFFLVVDRHLNDVALSNIRGRYKLLKDPKEWWSAKPPNYEKLKDLPVAEQVACQLIELKKKMEGDLSELSHKRIIRVKYEEFCQDPEYLTKKLENVFVSLDYRNEAKLFFEQSMNQAQTQEEKVLINLIGKKNATAK